MAEGRRGGKVEAEVKGVAAEQAWKMLDFCSLSKVMTSMESCTRLEGIDGQPGCVRYCVGEPVPVDGAEPFVAFSTEKLLAIDHKDMSFSYELTESNLELRGYNAEMKVVGDGGDGCRIEWSFAAESFGKWGTSEGFGESLLAALRAIVRRIELAVAAEKV